MESNHKIIPDSIPQDFDPNMSSDLRYLIYPSDDNNTYMDYTVYSSDGPTKGKFSTDNVFKLILITSIFGLGVIGNGTLAFVVNMTQKKTLRQKMLISVLAITCIIRVSLNFIRHIYVVTFFNHWKFHVMICKANAFLENFTTATFPYVLVFLVYDSIKFIGCCNSNKNGRIKLNQSKDCFHLGMLISTFISVLAVPIVLAVIVTVMTTTNSISSYGEGVTVKNITVCSLDVNLFQKYTPFKTYKEFHSAVWLVFVPMAIIAIMYISIAIVACFKKCKCMRRAHYDINNQIILEEKAFIAKNWFITIICLCVVFVCCYPPYEIMNTLTRYLNISLHEVSIMIIFLLFYIPPAVIPVIFCTIDTVIRHGYCKYIFCCCCYCCSRSNLRKSNHSDDVSGSKRSCNSICSSTIYTKSNITTPVSRTTCTSVSIGSDSEYDPYILDEEKTHIIPPPSPDLSQCSSYDEWGSQVSGNRGRYKVKDKILKGNDSEDSKPILVTSL